MLVEHYNVRVPFVLGAVAVLAGVALLRTVHQPLEDADRAAVSPLVLDAEDSEVFQPVALTAWSPGRPVAGRQ